VPYQQSVHFAAELERVAGKERVTLEIFQPPLEVFHADPHFETEENISRVFNFIDTHLN
jgi:hypothetical protein